MSTVSAHEYRGRDQAAHVKRRHQAPAEPLELVRLAPERTLRSYPYELSGGRRGASPSHGRSPWSPS